LKGSKNSNFKHGSILENSQHVISYDSKNVRDKSNQGNRSSQNLNVEDLMSNYQPEDFDEEL